MELQIPWPWIWNKVLNLLLLTVTAAVTISALYFALCIAPGENVMGDVQRIFYFHVGAAISCYALISVLFVASLLHLATRGRKWDYLAQSAAGVALLMASIVLTTGMIWGHSSWNTWWRWEPRLVSFLVLWLILVAYYLLRLFTERDERQSIYSAVVGILSAINVPIVIFSIRLLDHREQLHPQVVANQGLTQPGYVYALLLGIGCLILVSALLTMLRLRSLILLDALVELQQESWLSGKKNI